MISFYNELIEDEMIATVTNIGNLGPFIGK